MLNITMSLVLCRSKHLDPTSWWTKIYH